MAGIGLKAKPAGSRFADFKDTGAIGVNFDLTPSAALNYFQAKGLKMTFDWRDMLRDEHARAFTVAKMMDLDLLATVRAELDLAIASGQTAKAFRDSLVPKLQAAGWWGKQEVLDPLTGQTVTARLGSASRLNTIFRTNLQNAYAAGQWQGIQAIADIKPFLIYDAVDDHRTRPEHAALDGVIRPVGDKFWTTHFPPNGFNCRCSVIQVDKEQLDAMGLTPSKYPEQSKSTTKWKNPRTGKEMWTPSDIDPGFAYNPGVDRAKAVEQLLREKISALPADMRPNASAILKVAQTPAAELEAYIQANQAAIAKAFDIAKKPGAPGPDLKKLAAEKLAKELADDAAKIAAAKKKADDALNSLLAKAGGPEDAGKYLATALKTLQQDATWTKAAADVKTKDLLDLAAYLKKKTDTSKLLSLYKSQILKGKTPSPQAKDAFNALGADEKDAFLAKIQKQKAKAEAEAQAAALEAAKAAVLAKKDDIIAALKAELSKPDVADASVSVSKPVARPLPDEMTKVGAQAGSNPGGVYQDDAGVRWYVKTPASAEVARNEVLTAQLYRAAGVEVPDVYLTVLGGRPAVASRIVDGLVEDAARLTRARVAGVQSDFVVDAWLANWDVVGAAFDNLKLTPAGRGFRLDTGGGLAYRAQGAAKGKDWGPTVPELESMRDGTRNSGQVFRHVTKADLEDGIRRILAIDDADLEAIVYRAGLGDVEAPKMLATLRARRDYLRDKIQPKPAPEPEPIATGKVTPNELKRIQNARGNGYAIQGDSDQIEDQNVLVWQETAVDGKRVTRAQFKVRPDTLKRLDRDTKPAGVSDDLAEFSAVNAKVVEAIRGIASRAAKNSPLEAKDLSRVLEVKSLFSQALQKLDEDLLNGVRPLADVEAWRKGVQPWIARLEESVKPGAGQVAKWTTTDRFTPTLPPQPKGKASVWRNERSAFQAANIKAGHITRTDAIAYTSNSRRVADIDGARVELYVDEAAALKGTVNITVAGEDLASAEKIFDVMQKMGINAQRATPMDLEERYLTQIAYFHKRDFDSFLTLKQKHPGQAERIQAMKDFIKARTGNDPSKLPGYNARGNYQAFEHGRATFTVPMSVAEKADFDVFAKSHALYHRHTGGGTGIAASLDRILDSGGMVTPTTEKLRRGITPRGMSPEADLQTGGANYFFTRIVSALKREEGYYFKPQLLRRLDAISYDSDVYGRTDTTKFVLQNRRTGVQDWTRMASYGSNETILKDGLSMFDGLDYIRVAAHAKNDVLNVLRKHFPDGRWPDGRAIEDLVKTV